MPGQGRGWVATAALLAFLAVAAGAFAAHGLESQGDPRAIALVEKGRRLSYREIDERSSALAHGLIARGVARGDRVLVFLDNTVEAVVSFWAVLKASAVVCMVSPQTKADKLTYLLNDSRAAALITDARLAPAFARATSLAPHLGTIIATGDLAAVDLPGRAVVAWAELVAGAAGEEAPRARCIDVDLAAIIYTSGSTGEPKGAMLTHRNVAFASWSVTTLLENTPDDVIIGVVPLAFNYGLYQWLMTVRLGATLVLERSFAFPVAILQRAAETGATGFPGVPTMYALLGELKDIPVQPLTRVRYVTSTAAALLPKHLEAIARWFPNATVYSMYGLTECKRVSWLPPADLAALLGTARLVITNGGDTLLQSLACGCAIAEFPTTLEAARAARAAGMGVVMGAPNLVIGGSHSGNVAAAEIVAAGLLDAFSSDYVPASLLQAAFRLRDGFGLAMPEAIAPVTRNPARLLGLADRGSIAPGLRADLVRVCEIGAMPACG